MNDVRSVCVFCAASPNIHPSYCRTARRLGQILASQGIAIKYGGGTKGLMGCLAEGALRCNGSVTGVIPDYMQPRESPQQGKEGLIVVSSMQERKAMMRENTDAVIALPGGTGTLEELLEIITLKRLGFYSKPVVILNSNDYYAGFLLFFEKMIAEQFLGPHCREIFSVVDSPEEVIPAVRNAPCWVAGNDCQS